MAFAESGILNSPYYCKKNYIVVPVNHDAKPIGGKKIFGAER